MWCEDEAGPYSTVPYAAPSWQVEAQPAQQSHEYFPNGIAKLLTLFHPSTGQVRVKGVESCTNVVLHDWLQQQLQAILEELPPQVQVLSPEVNRAMWETWRQALTIRFTLPSELPPLRMLLVCDNLAGLYYTSVCDLVMPAWHLTHLHSARWQLVKHGRVHSEDYITSST